MEKVKVGIIGAGSWGLALSKILTINGHSVTLWTTNNDDINEFNTTRQIKKYLPDIKFDESIKITDDKEEVIKDKDIIITALPSAVTKQVIATFKDYFNENQVIINVSKGFEKETRNRLSVAIKEVVPQCEVAVLSGPSHAEEVAKEMYTAVVIATPNRDLQKRLVSIFSNDFFRVYRNDDIVGVEIGGALKNIIALAVGITDGLGQGDNLIAALMTRSMVEVSKVGVKMGANPITFIGLSGFGDLIVTCGSEHSRNRRAGKLLGQGYSYDEVKKQVGMVIEGFECLEIAREIVVEYNIDAPIIEQLYEVVFKGKDVKSVLGELMGRSNKSEQDSFSFF